MKRQYFERTLSISFGLWHHLGFWRHMFFHRLLLYIRKRRKLTTEEIDCVSKHRTIANTNGAEQFNTSKHYF